MSIKKLTFGNVDNVTVASFGFGTVRVVNSTGKNHKAILLGSNKEPKEIGSIGDKHITSDEFNPEIAIVFHNEESFSVFEEFIQNIREEYNSEK